VRPPFSLAKKKQSKTDVFVVVGETGFLNIRQERPTKN
jgi:hypothetical protein